MKSMTGYGRTEFQDEAYHIIAEIKSLNSKFFDLSIKIPKVFQDKEIELRSLISSFIERGKVNVCVEMEFLKTPPATYKVNKQLFFYYYDQLKEIANEVEDDTTDIFRMAIQSPDVMVSPQSGEFPEEAWGKLKTTLNEALSSFDEFRSKEGETLKNKLRAYLDRIEEELEKVNPLEKERLEQIKNRLLAALNELNGKIDADKNRFEQELIYYLEKYDIEEEKVRLKKHINHFRDCMDEGNNGKKLGFIAQEMGREINTLGAKAYYAPLQKVVVNMKEELDKIKEQSMNIL